MKSSTKPAWRFFAPTMLRDSEPARALEAVLRGVVPFDASGSFDRARTIVRAYYVAMLGLAAVHALDLFDRHLVASHALWPLVWAPAFGPSAIALVRALFVLGPLAAVILPDRRPARILAFLGYLEFGAFLNSFGKINHDMHLWVLTSFVLVFLPSGTRANPERRPGYLYVLWCAQAAALLTYSMAGVAKLIEAIAQYHAGDRYWLFSPEALSIHVAARAIDVGNATALGKEVVAHPAIGFGLFMATLVLELASFAASFRPRLHRAWGLALILMHLGIMLVMAVHFYSAMLLVAVLLCGSPFAGDLRRRSSALAVT